MFIFPLKKNEYIDENSAKQFWPLMLTQNCSVFTEILKNSERQMLGKHGHVVISAVCHLLKRNAKSFQYFAKRG